MKKQSAVMTQRDKRLLIFLCAVIIAFLDYYFLINPALEKGSALKAEEIQVQQEYDRVSELINNVASLEEQASDQKVELTEKYAVFFYSLNQERILYQLNQLMESTGFSASDCEFGDPELTNFETTVDMTERSSYPLLDLALNVNPELSEFVQDYISSEEESTLETLSDDVIPTYEITLNFEDATYASVMKFITALESMNKAIILEKVDMHTASSTLNGQIVISLYAMPKVTDDESDYLNFTPSVSTGKTDPFQ